MNDGEFEERLIAEWAKHRAEGRRRGFDDRGEWTDAPEWVHDEVCEWVRRDSAWRLLIGVRLANRAVEKYESTLGETR